MLGHFGVRIKVFGRGFHPRCQQGRNKVFLYFFDFVVWEKYVEFLVAGSIPGVGRVEKKFLSTFF